MQVFFRLGCLGFGGPLATMAMMEEECSRKRGWVSAERFAEMYAVCKVLPGPVATQMAIYLGSSKAGIPGGILAGTLFVLPAFLLVLLFSWLYVSLGAKQAGLPGMAGLQAGALAVIFLSTWALWKPYKARWGAWAIALASAALVAWRASWEPGIILAFGLWGACLASRRSPAAREAGTSAAAAAAGAAALGLGAEALGRLGSLAWVCFKAGAFVFGTGLAIVPLLEADSVTRHHWLTHSQFMDGLAIGQVTPGPVVITATFIGFLAAGVPGSLLATAMIFLPAFINILVIVPRIWRKLSGTPAARGFTSWALPAVVGGILATSFRLAALVLLPKPWLLLILLGAGFAIYRFKVPAWAAIPACGLVHAVLSVAAPALQ